MELLRCVMGAGEIRAPDLANRRFVTKAPIRPCVNEMLEGPRSPGPDHADGRATPLGVLCADRKTRERERQAAARCYELCASWLEGHRAIPTTLLQRRNDGNLERRWSVRHLAKDGGPDGRHASSTTMEFLSAVPVK
ncbi:MAG: hypothetical protein ACYDB2_00555 [Acidimicrobiales bacterium]